MPEDMQTSSNRNAIVAAYAIMFERRIAAGWEPTLLTFMFRPIAGGVSAQQAVMKREITRIYYVLLTRQFRKPEREPRSVFPLWLAAPDLPVFKHEKAALRDIAINDGLHYHAIAAVAPKGRRSWVDEWGGCLSDFIDDNQPLFSGAGRMLTRLHAVPIERDLDYVVEYGFKSILRFSFDTDDVLILPNAASERTHTTKAERRHDRETAQQATMMRWLNG